MNAQINEKPLTIADALASGQIGEIVKLENAAKTLRESVAESLEGIKRHGEKLADAINSADTKKTEQSGLWHDVAVVAARVAEVSKEMGIPQWAGEMFRATVREVMPSEDDEGRRAKTVRSYLSTGGKVVVDYLIGDGLPENENGQRPDVTAIGYDEIRKLYAKPRDVGLDNLRDECVKAIRFIAKYGNKYGSADGKEKPGEAFARLEKVRDALEPLVSDLRDRQARDSKAAKADATLRDNRQQAPSEAGTVETTTASDAGREMAGDRDNAEAKPEAPRTRAA